MSNVRQELAEQLLDLAWSLWTELGVAGVRRKHRQVAIMPEELLLLTSALSSLDPRLRDESIDWCCSYHGHISTARLRSLFKLSCEEQQARPGRRPETMWDDLAQWAIKVARSVARGSTRRS